MEFAVDLFKLLDKISNFACYKFWLKGIGPLIALSSSKDGHRPGQGRHLGALWVLVLGFKF